MKQTACWLALFAAAAGPDGAQAQSARSAFEMPAQLAPLSAAGIPAQSACEGLPGLASLRQLPGLTIKQAVEIPAGPLPAGTPAPTFPPNTPAAALPTYCKVTAVIAPAIGFELWMPTRAWNGRFQGMGNHGFAGALDYGDMSWQLSRGYVVASTDTGHAGNDPLPWMRNPQQLFDYGYRAVHEMTTGAKAIVAAFYGQPARFSYWNGCSTGGKEALMEAQRYPADYDGINVGDANFDQIGNRAQYVWNGQATFAKPATRLPADKLKLINKTVLAACDRLDGVADGVIEDPRQCHFEPRSLQCKPGEDPAACLSADQVGALTKLYAGPSNPRTGQSIYPGLTVGSELGWGGVVAGPTIYSTADQFFKYMVFNNPDWDYRGFDFDSDWRASTVDLAAILNADSPDLRAFERTGGKMLQYHGWKDTVHPAMRSVQYYESVLDSIEPKASRARRIARTQDFYRLFMVPASNGCASAGPGADMFDPMDTITKWVEQGEAPGQMVVAHRSEGKVDQTRALCPYPQVARYRGNGGTGDAGSFACEGGDAGAVGAAGPALKRR